MKVTPFARSDKRFLGACSRDDVLVTDGFLDARGCVEAEAVEERRVIVLPPELFVQRAQGLSLVLAIHCGNNVLGKFSIVGDVTAVTGELRITSGSSQFGRQQNNGMPASAGYVLVEAVSKLILAFAGMNRRQIDRVLTDDQRSIFTILVLIDSAQCIVAPFVVGWQFR
jgi:hypothetical protein